MKLSCDCGNIEIEAAPPSQVTNCNCAICCRYHALWGYYPPQEVNVKIGDLGADVYLRGEREIEFVRCASCGCVTHYQSLPNDPDPVIAVNFRMAQDLLHGVPVRYFSGKDA